MRLILIRHTDSEHSQRGIIAGIEGCPGLTTAGVEQARMLAARLRSTHEIDGLHVLLSSPVKLAVQTAETLRGAFGLQAVEQEMDLCELHPGKADGLAHDTNAKRFGGFDLLAEPERPFSRGGESWLAFRSRVDATLHRLADRHASETVVAVTHAGFIVAAMLSLLDIPRPGPGARFDPVHTSLTEWRFENGWTLQPYNDAAHLIGLRETIGITEDGR